MTRLKEKKEFKREYIPVFFTGIILILLIGALVFTILYDGKLDLEEVPVDYGHRVNELNVDVDRNKCSTDVIKKLNDEAKKVKLEYKEETKKNKNEGAEKTATDDEKFWLVILKNMTDNFYVKITNDKTDTEVIINKDNLVDGKYQFETYHSNKIRTYTISLISNNADCNEQVIRMLELKVPAYNDSSTQNITSTTTYTTKCLSCEIKEKNDKRIRRENITRTAIIIGVVIGMLLDSVLIIYLIIRLKRYDI